MLRQKRTTSKTNNRNPYRPPGTFLHDHAVTVVSRGSLLRLGEGTAPRDRIEGSGFPSSASACGVADGEAEFADGPGIMENYTYQQLFCFLACL